MDNFKGSLNGIVALFLQGGIIALSLLFFSAGAVALAFGIYRRQAR